MNEFSIIPLNANKVPVLSGWKQYQEEITPKDIWSNHYQKGGNLGLITGHKLYFLEVIDVDLKYDNTGQLWTKLKAKVPQDLFDKLVIQKTVNSGYHLLYFRESIPMGNQKLAQRNSTPDELKKKPEEKIKVLLETRGKGGYIVVSPSKGYEFIQGNTKSLPTFTDKQADHLLSICRQFNQVYTEAHTPKQKVFEDYKQRGPKIESLLTSSNWEVVRSNGEFIHLRRPGKDSGISGSIIKNEQFKCFSTSSEFDTDKLYDNVAVFTQLNCNGNYQESRKLLEQQGYGEPVIREFKPNGQDSQPVQQEFDQEEQFKKDLLRFKKDNEELKQNATTGIIEMIPLIEGVNGEPVVFDGNLTGIQGGYGVGKSRMAQAIGSLIIKNEKDLIISGLRVNKMAFNKHVLIYIDTERSKKDRLPKAIQQIKRNAGFDPLEDVEGFETATLRGVSRISRRKVVQSYLSEMRLKYEGRKLFFILDITTDMVKSFNDEVDSMQFLDFINDLIDEYECTGILVIHVNRGGKDSLGHLGAELDRKVTTKISIEYNNGAVEVSLKKNNEGGKGNSYLMSYDDETDAFQYDANATTAKGVNKEVLESIHQLINVGEKMTLQLLAENVRKTGIDLTVKTITNHINTMAKKMVPVWDGEGEIIGYLLKEVEREQKRNVAYITLVRNEQVREAK